MTRFRKLTATITSIIAATCIMSMPVSASGTFNFHIDKTGTVTNTTFNAGYATQENVIYTTSIINNLNAKGISYKFTVNGIVPTNGSGSFTEKRTYNYSHTNSQIKKYDSIMVALTLQPYDSAFGSSATGMVYAG